MQLLTTAVCLLLAVSQQTIAQNVRNVGLHCRVVPSPGRCAQAEKRTFWSYSTKIGACTELYGCYGIRDRNVFQSRAFCERSCFTTGNNDATSNSYLDCEVNPSPGLCQDSEKRTYFTYSSKINACVQINGCYTIRDKNIFLNRDSCRRICIINRPETLPVSPLFPSRNNTPAVLPAEIEYKVSVECSVNPSAGACLPSERRTYYTFSSKSGSCVQIYGCYSVRDRNVFLSRDMCRNNCILKDTTDSGNIWSKDPQCYINPSPGRCLPEDRQSMWTYSSKTNNCQQLYGCYSVRDRNVFRTLNGCRNACIGKDSQSPGTTPSPDLNIKIAMECRINPSPGVCTDREKRTFYSYSSKTGDCDELYGCYSVRDRNVYLTIAGCRRSCFISNDAASSTVMESQCYISPSPGRCLEDEKRTYFTYSTKINSCVRIYGCYGIRDRNVFLTRRGCQQACSGDIPVRPATPADNIPSIDIVPLPNGPNYSIAPECRINPSPGICNENQKRNYFTYSSKTSSCVQIYGCYNIRDRNVFMRRDGCRRNCYITGTTPSGVMDSQCYINPSPGRCRENEKRNFWSYSSKTMSCTRIYGCYSIRDRNVFLRRDPCERACVPNGGPVVTTTPAVPINQVSLGCRINPSPGRCSERERRTYFSYSSKTHRCTEIYGCYSIRDRNVFLTRESCQRGCFEKEISGSEPQCSMNPSPGRCAVNQRRSFYSYSSKTSSCLQIYGCYSLRDRNVFMTLEGCRRRCEPPAVMPPIDTSARTEPNLVDIRTSGSQMVDIRTGGNGANMVDIRNSGSNTDGGISMVDIRAGTTPSMIDIRRSGGNMVDIRNDRTNMVDIRRAGSSNMVDIRNERPAGTGMVDIRGSQTNTANMVDIRSNNNPNFVDVRNNKDITNMVDVRQGSNNMVDIRGDKMVDIRGNRMVDIRSGNTGTNMVDIRSGNTGTNMVDIRSGNTGTNMVDIRGNTGNSMVDIRGNNMVDIRARQSDPSMVDIRSGSKMVDVRGSTGANMVDIRGNTGANMVDIRGNTGANMVDIRSNTGGNMVDIRRNNMVDIRRNSGSNNMVDIRGTSGSNFLDVRNDNRLVDIRGGDKSNNMVDIRQETNGNFVDVRGGINSPNLVDIRQGSSGNFVDVRNSGNMVDIRGTTNNNLVDIRGTPSNNLVDIRGLSGNKMVDIRGTSGNTMVDIRGTSGNKMVDVRGTSDNTNFVDVRNGGDGASMVDIRGDSTKFVDVRGASSGNNMVDIRGNNGASTNFVDVRNGNQGTSMIDIRNSGSSEAITNFVDVRGSRSGANMVDIRSNSGSSQNNFVDIRNGNTGSNMVDIRRNGQSGSNLVDIRTTNGNFVDVRGGQTGPRMVDIRGNSAGNNFVDIRNGKFDSNMVDIRGKTAGGTNFVDVRNGRVDANMVDIRGKSTGGTNFVDVRNGRVDANMVDIRGKSTGGTNFVDVRNGRVDANMVDIRGKSTGGTNFVDVRNGQVDTKMVDIRGNTAGTTNFVDVRNGQVDTKMVDIRGNTAGTTNFVDVRNGPVDTNMVDIRGNTAGTTNFVDVRNGPVDTNMVDIRGNTAGTTNFVDVRNGQVNTNMVDIRGKSSGGTNFVDVRGGKTDQNMIDIRGTSGSNSNFVDVRRGKTDPNMVDIRGNTQTNSNFVDIRATKTDPNMVDIRSNSGTNFVDVRNGQTNMVDIRGTSGSKGSASFVDIRNGNSNAGMVDIRGNQAGNNFVDIRGGNANKNMVDIRGNTGSKFIDIRGGAANDNMVDIRGNPTDANFVDIRGGSTNMVDIRGGSGSHSNTSFIDIRDGSTGIISDIIPIDPQSLTDLPIINIAPGIRIARECLINPTPGICLENQQKSFWTFSTKSNSCTKIMGCFDIHDRNTWLSLDGCRRNCLKNDSEVDTSGALPLECQLNPTPGRCLPSEERKVWIYNTKLGACTQLEGCYDHHDRNVWSSRARCRSKCKVTSTILAPEIPYNVEGISIHPECHINPSPGVCTENQKKTFWTFSSKASACTRVTGCYNIRDRNTWRSRQECRTSCLVNASDVTNAKPLECKLVPSPGRCLDSQKKSVYTFSDKLGICVEITGCYDFHDRNVWRTLQACNNRCHVTQSVIPDLTKYDIALECKLNPIPGRCQESQKRTFYSFSGKAGGCVEIYGCYTINDRNVWYTRNGCQESCLLPRPGSGDSTQIAKTCLRDPILYECLPNQRRLWYKYNRATQQCEKIEGCYRLGEHNVFISKRRCEIGCLSKPPEYIIDGVSRECRLNPTPGVCTPDERRTYWSYSQKTGTCLELTGCYTIRDRNIWLTREMCRNNCIKREVEPRSEVLPNFLSGSNGQDTNTNGVRRGRRGRILTRNMNRNAGGVVRDLVVTRIDTFDVSINPGVQSNTGAVQTPTIPPPPLHNTRDIGNTGSQSSKVLENLFLLDAAS